jgi:hypothetical protein
MKKIFLTLKSTTALLLLFFSFQIINAQQISNEDISKIQLEISIIKPENKTYADVDVILSYEINKEVISTSYSLDGLGNVTISNDIILTDLSAGKHQLILYAQDQDGNVAASETIIFTIKPYPSMLVIISLSFVGLIGLVFLVKAIKQKE